MGVLNSPKCKDDALVVHGKKNVKSNENKIVKKPKSEIEEEDSYEDLIKKVKKKRSTSKCSYCRNGFYWENKCFKKNMEIMYQLLKKHNIEVPDELEKHVDSSEHCQSVQSQGDINYALSAIFKYFPHIYDIYLLYDI